MAAADPQALIPPVIVCRCPECGADQDLEYVMSGARVECARCGKTVVLKRILGSTTPNTGYAITIGAAETMFADAGRRERVAAIVGQTGHVLQSTGEATEILDLSGRRVDPVRVHRLIQSRPALQFDLYQLWMDLSHQGY